MLGGFAGAIGLFVGIMVSSLALEEVRGLAKSFVQARAGFFLLAVGIVSMQAGVVALIVSLLVMALLLHSLAEEDIGKMVGLVLIAFLIIMATSPVAPVLIGLFLLVGLMEAGVWAGRHERFLEKHMLHRQTWRAIFISYAPFLFLPLASIIVLW